MSSLLNTQVKQITSPSIFQRIAKADKCAIEEFTDNYGGLIWAVARKYTDSKEKAEILTMEIFQDIWEFSKFYDSNSFDEFNYITLIIRRRLTKRLLINSQTIIK